MARLPGRATETLATTPMVGHRRACNQNQVGRARRQCQLEAVRRKDDAAAVAGSRLASACETSMSRPAVADVRGFRSRLMFFSMLAVASCRLAALHQASASERIVVSDFARDVFNQASAMF